MFPLNAFLLATACLISTVLAGCSASQNSTLTSVVVTVPVPPKISVLSASFAKGADISWVSQMEGAGYKFYTATGLAEDCFQLLKEKGMNSIRLRVWVNPADGWSNKADVLEKAKRAHALGMRIMIDFHYSDSWADPGTQTKPASWSGQALTALNASVYAHTLDVMNTLTTAGIVPEWVQVGNETNDGMLWNEGRASANMAGFASLVSSGYTAVKAVSSTTKVIVHISNGYDNNLFRWMFDGLTKNGAKYDIVGMSLYPTAINYADLDTQCLANMNDMISRYGKQVMVCEVGMKVDSPTACKAFLTDIMLKTNSISGGNGLGVFYWEPECYNWKNYSSGAFDNTGKPTIALDPYSTL